MNNEGGPAAGGGSGGAARGSAWPLQAPSPPAGDGGPYIQLAHGVMGAPPACLLNNCRVLDPRQGVCSDLLLDVLISDGKIRAIKPADYMAAFIASGSPPAEAAAAATAQNNAWAALCFVAHPESIDCRGLVLMPGLMDAHVHVTACTANLPGLLSLPESLVAARAARVLEGMLM